MDVVPAARTVLVVHDGTLDPAVLEPVAVPSPMVDSEVVEIPVVYDGEDLEEVAEETGLDVATIISRGPAPRQCVAPAGVSRCWRLRA